MKKYQRIGLIVLAVIIFYGGSRFCYNSYTSPKQVESNGGRTVYDVVKLTEDYMEGKGIACKTGSQEYIDWLSDSLMSDKNSDIKKQKWYKDFEAYATKYLVEAQTMAAKPVMEFLGYYTVVPKDMRDKTIAQL